MNGIKILLCLIPGIAKVRLVINKFVNDIVVLIPAKTTERIKTSCEPTPVYFILELNGVINVQPAVVNVRAEHLDTKIFFLLDCTTLSAAYQKDSG
jgi:hypothetical protein